MLQAVKSHNTVFEVWRKSSLLLLPCSHPSVPICDLSNTAWAVLAEDKLVQTLPYQLINTREKYKHGVIYTCTTA